MIQLPRCVLKPTHGKHFYDTDYGFFPSVTTALGATKSQRSIDILTNWRKREGGEVADYIMSKTSGIGTAAHLMNEKYQARKHGLPIPLKAVNEEYALFGMAHHLMFRPFLDSVEKVFALEQAVFSSSLKLAGTIDCIGIVDGQVCVIDYKTKGKPQREDWMEDYYPQGALYAKMWNEHVSEEFRATKIIIAASSEYRTLQTFGTDPLEHEKAALERVARYYESRSGDDGGHLD